MSLPKRASSPSTSRPRRVFVSVTEKLQCGSPVQAIALPQTGFVSSGKPIAGELVRDALGLRLGDADQDQVLLARDPDVARPTASARSAIAISWSPEISPRRIGTPIEQSPGSRCGWMPRWLPGREAAGSSV